MRVGDPTMYEYITRFGFGSRTGIELPGETAGLVWPLKRWQPSSIGSVAIGQEVGVTPLHQLIVMERYSVSLSKLCNLLYRDYIIHLK